MSDYSGKSTMSSNIPNDDSLQQKIDAMSASEVAAALEDLVLEMDEENYDPALIDAYLDALDRKAPMPEMPSKEESYASFQKRLLQLTPKSAAQAVPSVKRFHRIKNAALVAVLSVICMLGIIMVAQAAGVDVWGTMASWTDEIFSFGTIRSEGSYDENRRKDPDYTTLQEALSAYQVTEVCAPAWIPEGYTLRNVDTTYASPIDQLFICAEYSNGTDDFLFTIMNYNDEPGLQIEKTDAPVETFEMNDSIVYLLENNNNNNIAAWVTEHFECTIFGTLDKADLEQVVRSTQDAH